MERFGPWNLQRRLGAGGMAEAFLARRADGTGGPVCVKRILPGHKGTPGFAAMFRDEIALTRALRHDHIVAVHDSGDVDGVLWLAMEYVAGPSLAAVLARAVREGQRPTIGQALEIVRQLALGLDAAHTAKAADGQPLGLVHRDVSPQNILFTRTGVLKLSDFGIARAEERLARTATGVMKGKLGYLAPEQITGDVVDHRADQFAAGIVLWEVLCTRRLFRGPELEVLEAVVSSDVPPPSRFRDDVPPVVDALVARMLQRTPSARFPTMGAVATAIDGLLAEETSSNRALTPLVMLEDGSSTMRIPRTRFTIDDTARNLVTSRDTGAWSPPPSPGFDEATVEGDIVEDDGAAPTLRQELAVGPANASPFDEASGTGARPWPVAARTPGESTSAPSAAPARQPPPPRPPVLVPLPAAAPVPTWSRGTIGLTVAAVAVLTGAVGVGVGVWIGRQSSSASPDAGAIATAPPPASGGSAPAGPAPAPEVPPRPAPSTVVATSPIAPAPQADPPGPPAPSEPATPPDASAAPTALKNDDIDAERLQAIDERWQALRAVGSGTPCLDMLLRLEGRSPRRDFLVAAEPIIDSCSRSNDLATRTRATSGRSADDAKAYMVRGEYAEAVKVLKAALVRNPADPRTHLQLGICYAQLRKNTLAREHYNRFLELQPTGPDADRVRKSIESL